MTHPRAADSYDVTFLVGSQKHIVQGNKAYLAYTSTVFHRMFFSDFLSKNEIEVPDVDADAFEVMINSLSGRDAILNEENVAQVYYAAEKYDLRFLRRVCKGIVVNSIDSTNALTILNTFQHYNESDINDKCLSIILDDPLPFFKKPEFLKASADVVRSIFKSTGINCSTQDVKKALLDWMTNNGMANKNDEKKWVEVVENKLQITREELEMKMLRPHLFRQINYIYPKFSFDPKHIIISSYENSFILEEKMSFFLHGFGLVLGKVSQEQLIVTVTTETGYRRELGTFIVEKKGPIDLVSIQDVLFEKIPIFNNKVKVKIFFPSTSYARPFIQCNDEKRCLSYLILSKMH